MSTVRQPTVSIVIPCYNYGHFLSETLESILAQTWPYWECIIVDDGSTDNTAQVAHHFQDRDSRIKYVAQNNQGVSTARNRGLSECKGSYVQLLDADDKLEARKLEQQVAYLEQHPAVDIVYGGMRYFQEKNQSLSADISKRMAFPKISGVGGEVLVFLIRRNIMVINAPLVRSSVFTEVGLFNPGLVGNEDWEYWIRCGLAGRSFHYQDAEATTALVRVHPHSATQNVLPMLVAGLEIRVHLQKLQLPAGLHKENHYRIGLQLAKLGKYQALHGDLFVGFKHAAQGLWRMRYDVRIMAVIFFLLVPSKVASSLVIAADRLRNFLRTARSKSALH
jgi:glycosyltransferase involved in cell wall biosynthesis